MFVPRSRLVRFVILFPGRTGSTYLVSALDSHPRVHAEGEVLGRLRDEGAERQADWTRRFLRGPLLGREQAVGFKTKLRDLWDQDVFREQLQASSARIIVLDRRNDVKHAISRITARLLRERTGRWNRYEGSDELGLVEVDPADFASRLQAVEEEKDTIRTFVADIGLRVLHLDYEDLLTDPSAVFATTLGFLDVPIVPLEGATLKNTSDDLRDVVANLDALRADYVGTPYESMFDEVLVPRS